MLSPPLVNLILWLTLILRSTMRLSLLLCSSLRLGMTLLSRRRRSRTLWSRCGKTDVLRSRRQGLQIMKWPRKSKSPRGDKVTPPVHRMASIDCNILLNHSPCPFTVHLMSHGIFSIITLPAPRSANLHRVTSSHAALHVLSMCVVQCRHEQLVLQPRSLVLRFSSAV